MEFGLDTFGDVTRDASGALLPQDQVLRNVVAEAVLAAVPSLASLAVPVPSLARTGVVAADAVRTSPSPSSPQAAVSAARRTRDVAASRRRGARGESTGRPYRAGRRAPARVPPGSDRCAPLASG